MSKILIFFLFLVVSFNAIGQSSQDFDFFIVEPKVDQPKKSKIKKDKNELELTVGLLFGVYQNYISTQDGSTCSFYPSCSRYCRTAISKHGLIKGGVQGFDRLVRCNGLSPNKYKADYKKQKLLDDVK